MSVILTANPGTPVLANGLSEATYLSEALANPTAINLEGCSNVNSGQLFGAPALVVVAGEGPGRPQTCVYALMACAAVVKEMIYFGTAGFSPRLGGLLNPPDQCAAPTARGTLVRPGGVCVTTHAVNWDCQGGSWSQMAAAVPNVCSLPGNASQPMCLEEGNPAEAGNAGWACVPAPAPAPPGSRELADELAAAGAAMAKPPPSPAVVDYLKSYWGNVTVGTGFRFACGAFAPAAVFTPEQCAEVDSVLWWQGAPWDATFFPPALRFGLRVCGLPARARA